MLHAKKMFIALALLVLLMPMGCATFENVYADLNMDFGAIQNVAVMPFLNLSGEEGAEERVRDAFMGSLLATEALYVIPSGEVARGIMRVGIRTPTTPTSEEISKVSNILEVEAVVTGVLREYGVVRSGSSAANIVSVSLQMIEVETGRVIWSASSTKGGITWGDRLLGGGGEAMNHITEEVVNDLLDKLFK